MKIIPNNAVLIAKSFVFLTIQASLEAIPTFDLGLMDPARESLLIILCF